MVESCAKILGKEKTSLSRLLTFSQKNRRSDCQDNAAPAIWHLVGAFGGNKNGNGKEEGWFVRVVGLPVWYFVSAG